MSRRIILSSIILLFVFSQNSPLLAQSAERELSFEQSVQMLKQENRSLKIADKEIEWTKSEHQRMNALWYPVISASGTYVHMSNPIEAIEPLNQFTDPVKDFVQSIIPGDQIISSILDKIGTYSLHVPLAPQNVTTIDANIIWPVFTGGKRIYADRIGKSMISVSELNREQVGAQMQILLVESYFGLRLGQSVVDVREQSYRALEQHYQNALKLEANGMIDKAERLFVQVNMDEAKRELQASLKEVTVAQNALKALIRIDTSEDIVPCSPLFINDTMPDVDTFKTLIEKSNYAVNQLELQNQIVDNELRMARSEYLPTIALFGKQTLYAHGIEKNLIPRSMVGVGLTWNLFDGLARERRIEQSRITKQAVELTREKAIDDIGIGVDKFYSQLQNAMNSVTALNTTIELSRELVRMRKKAFAEGMATSSQVIDAEVMLSKVQIASLLAYYQYDVALINLLSACGTPEQFQQYSTSGKAENNIFNN